MGGFGEDGMSGEISSSVQVADSGKIKHNDGSYPALPLDLLMDFGGKETKAMTEKPQLTSSMITQLAESERMEGLINQIKSDPTSLGKYIEKNMEIDPELFELVQDHMSILQDFVLGEVVDDERYDEQVQMHSKTENWKNNIGHGSGAKNNPVCLDDDDDEDGDGDEDEDNDILTEK